MKGYEVKGPNGNSIFLPAAGVRGGSELDNAGKWGYYWSSSLNAAYSYYAHNLLFDSGKHDLNDNNRHYGFTVRPVHP